MDNLTFRSMHRPSSADIVPEGQRRFRLTVEFDGTAYGGWQRQTNAPSIQQTLETALESLTGKQTAVIGCSRTDAGVHAAGLVCHFDSDTRIPPEKLAFAMNTRLPQDVRVRASGIAPAGFHARYSACAKAYCYAFYNHPQMCAIGRAYMAHVPMHMEIQRMREAAVCLLGTHDFGAFAASGNVTRSTVRTLYAISIWREGPVVRIRVLGNGFLYNMVRILAGTLAEIGTGKRDASVLPQALERGDRLLLGATAPASGLTLEQVFYVGDEPAARALFAGHETIVNTGVDEHAFIWTE